jgi:hypothetical protein
MNLSRTIAWVADGLSDFRLMASSTNEAHKPLGDVGLFLDIGKA